MKRLVDVREINTRIRAYDMGHARWPVVAQFPGDMVPTRIRRARRRQARLEVLTLLEDEWQPAAVVYQREG